MDDRYLQALCNFDQTKLAELIDLVILDDLRIREEYYTKHGSYPAQRELIQKLKEDLLTVEAFNNGRN